MRRNNRQLPDVRKPRNLEPADPACPPLRQNTPGYYRILSKLCPVERWAVIVHRAVAAAEKGDARAREWLSQLLLGKPDQLIEEVSAGYAAVLVRQVVGALRQIAEQHIGNDRDRQTFRGEAQEALRSLLPRCLVETLPEESEDTTPRIIADMMRGLSPETAEAIFQGYREYIHLLLKAQRGWPMNLPSEMEANLRQTLLALGATAPETDPDATTPGEDDSPA